MISPFTPITIEQAEALRKAFIDIARAVKRRWHAWRQENRK